MLQWFARERPVQAQQARDMLGWDNDGFYLDGTICISGQDRGSRLGVGRALTQNSAVSNKLKFPAFGRGWRQVWGVFRGFA
jgi:hypothetical protein